MFSILGLGGLAAAAFLTLVPKALEIVLILLKAALQGFIEYLRMLWKGITEASMAGWTLVLTAWVLGYLWTSGSACMSFSGASSPILGSSGYSAPAGRGAVSTTPDVYMSVKDIFCYWFGCM